MCDICRQHPCHPRCPNYDEVIICTQCERRIKEDFYEFHEDDPICVDCVQDYIDSTYLVEF